MALHNHGAHGLRTAIFVSGRICILALVVLIFTTYKSYQAAGDRPVHVNKPGVYPRIHYVSPGGSDGNPGTQAQPWKTLAHTVRVLQAGDTAVFMDGTYDETRQAITANDGTAAAPITIEAQHRGAAKIVWHNLQSTWGKLGIANSYWTVKGFEFTEDARGNSTDDVLMLVDGPYFNPSKARATHVQILGNTAHGAYEKCYKFGFTDDTVVDGNTCYDITHDGIDFVQSDRIQISNNNIYHVGRTGIFEKGGSRSVRVFGNYVHEDGAYNSGYPGVPNGIELGDETDANASLCSTTSCYEEWNGVAYDNVVVSNPPGHINSGYSMYGCDKCALFNNVAIGTELGIDLRDASGDVAKGWSGNPMTTDPVVENNIIMNSTQSALAQQRVHGVFRHDHNLWYGNHDQPVEAHGIYADPRFVDPAHDWRLRPDSPALSAGVVATFIGYFGKPIDVSRDRAGVGRSAPWDIGVYATRSPNRILATSRARRRSSATRSSGSNCQA